MGSSGVRLRMRTFDFNDTKRNLPLTLVNQSISADTAEQIIEHEDAHQEARYEDNGKVSMSYESRASQNDFYADICQSFLYQTPEEALSHLWLTDINKQLLMALKACGDEIQAFLSEGASIATIRKSLMSTTPNMPYDYVADVNYRLHTVAEIRQQASSEEDAEATIAVFKETVRLARAEYKKFLNKYLNKVSQIYAKCRTQHPNSASTKVAQLVRHTTIPEFYAITRYLTYPPTHELPQIKDMDVFDVSKLLMHRSNLELQTMLTDYTQPIQDYMSVIRTIISAVPRYFFKNDLEIWPLTKHIDNSPQGIRNAATCICALPEASVVWEKSELQEYTSFTVLLTTVTEHDKQIIEAVAQICVASDFTE